MNTCSTSDEHPTYAVVRQIDGYGTMHTISRRTFITVKTEGAILPADLLQRIADGRGLDGLTPEDYHLAPNERLNEAINRSWNRLLGVWQSFDEQRSRLPESDSGVTLTRERWLLILFQELGYGRLSFQGKLTAGGTDYPISHNWSHAPIHLVSFRQDLDRKDSAAKRSPHSLLQEYLNRAEDSLWGFVSNGLRLRVLRDNVSLTRAAFVEFDLEAMLTGELYADFALLWLVCHQSRVEATPASSCWLERWSQAAAERGTRALDALRDGVQEAISVLGRGFLSHPANGSLRTALKSGELGVDEYYRQLLRLVYRLIFLFVAEDRDLLLVPGADAATRARYESYYSVGRLRSLAEARRGGPHPDLYRSLRLVCEKLREGYPALGLPALGSFLFSDRATPVLDSIDLANRELLDAVRALAFTEERRTRRPVDYKNLGSEELGSVYESLLELHPQLNVDAATFELSVAAGSERKTTGSYYTPTSLINCLLDSALEPVVTDRLREAKPGAAADAVLSIKVVDPAAGSGHFLIAAAHRLARHLARARTGDEEPSPAALRSALREVVRHCIHGVDINPMAVELCKVALWMETLEPGKPLGFLDRNIQCGNSLIGSTPRLLQEGIPDEAFTAITGDDKGYCAEFKKQNKKEREGQRALFTRDLQPWDRLGNLAAAVAGMEAVDDATLDGVRREESLYEELVRSAGYRYGRLLADAWCAAFVCKKTKEFAYPITEQVFREIERNPFNLPKWMGEEIGRLREQYQFFHWHLAFPHVFRLSAKGEAVENEQTAWNGGFDVVLGNPPWEASELAEREFFAARDPSISMARTQAERAQLILKLAESNPHLWVEWNAARRKQESERHFVRDSAGFALSAIGKLNTYRLFAELGSNLVSRRGMFGMVLKSGMISAQDSQPFTSLMTKRRRLHLGLDFINRRLLFPAVVANERFCLYAFGGPDRPTGGARLGFTLEAVEDMQQPGRLFSLSTADLEVLNPNDLSIPPIASERDKQLLLRIHHLHRAAVSANGNAWSLQYIQGHQNSATDSHRFTNNTLENIQAAGGVPIGMSYWRLPSGNVLVPVYEGKYIGQLNHRFGTFERVPQDRRFGVKAETMAPSLANLQDANYEVTPRYWMLESDAAELYEQKKTPRPWLFAFRDVCRAVVDARTVQACIMPRYPCNDSCPLLIAGGKENLVGFTGLMLNTLWASFVFDYAARQKIHGAHLTKAIAYQLPVPDPTAFSLRLGTQTYRDFITPRGLELTYVSVSLGGFARECGYDGPPFRWNENRRFLLRCELDAAYFHLYGMRRDEVDYIMESFPIVRRRDEEATRSDENPKGEHRTKRVILEMYDEMAEAMRTGQPYRTHLDPPPADPRIAHPPREGAGLETLRAFTPAPAAPVAQAGDERVAAPSVAEKRAGHKSSTAASVRPQKPAATHPAPAAVQGLFPDMAGAAKVKDAQPAKAPAKAQNEHAAEAAQAPLLIPRVAAPAGTYNERLAAVMKVRNDRTPTGIGTLIAALGDPDNNIRWLAALSLGDVRGEGVAAALAEFLTGDAPIEGRLEAVKLLGKIGGEKARAALSAAAKDLSQDVAVREAAQLAL